MRIRAAVLERHNSPLVLKNLELSSPKAGEALVKVVASSICQTDIGGIHGHYETLPLPVVLGHESSGIVQEVGEGVTKVRRGDHVVASVVVHCNECRNCYAGRFYACERFDEIAFEGRMPSGGTRLSDRSGRSVGHFFAQSSFATHAVMPVANLVKVPSEADLGRISPISCAVQTGAGAVINSGMEPGSSFAIFGCGGVGLSAVMGAKAVGGSEIIAVDVIEERLRLARDLGATRTINPTAIPDPVHEITEITRGGVDCAFECIGRQETIMNAVKCTRRFGTTILIGIPPRGTQLQFDFFTLFNKNVKGCVAGYANSDTLIPYLIKLYIQGRLPLDRMSAKSYPLDHINHAVEDMISGRVVKPLLKIE